jgi:PAS domain S-box-containing protein
MRGAARGVCFPIRGATGVLGAIEFLAREQREPDDNLLNTMTSLGDRIGHCVERWRAEDRVRESDARRGAILNAAFDCIITMDADCRVVEVNHATERTFGYRASEMVGRDLAELIIPPELRQAHRRGLERYVATNRSTMVGHPVELPAIRADGSRFPVEIAITRPRLAGPALFTGYLRDVTERKRNEQALRTLADEPAALRRVATVVASAADQGQVFSVVTEEVGHLLGAATSNMVRYEPDGTATVAGAWSTGDVRAVPVGTPVALDEHRPTRSSRAPHVARSAAGALSRLMHIGAGRPACRLSVRSCSVTTGRPSCGARGRCRSAPRRPRRRCRTRAAHARPTARPRSDRSTMLRAPPRTETPHGANGAPVDGRWRFEDQDPGPVVTDSCRTIDDHHAPGAVECSGSRAPGSMTISSTRIGGVSSRTRCPRGVATVPSSSVDQGHRRLMAGRSGRPVAGRSARC